MEKLDFFKGLGLTGYESKSVASLLKLKVASPKEISEDSRVPQNKLYQILKKFISLGILAELPDKKYQLINLKTFVSERISEKEVQLKELKHSSKKLEKVKNSDEIFFQIIRGQIATMNKISELNEFTEKEILGVQRNFKVWGQGLRVMGNSVKKGVNVRMVGVVDEETKKRAQEWKNCGAKIKKYNKQFGEFPLRFTIFDNRIARVTIGKPEIPESKNYITIVTNSRPLIATLRKQFLEMWKKCEKF